MIESEFDWYVKADLSRYSGEWIAIRGKKVVGHEKHLKDLMERVSGLEDCLMTKVSDGRCIRV